jgi:phenylpropionate dioxygenase-like ring-hydroxylating dioxygenase large terminal subunit
MTQERSYLRDAWYAAAMSSEVGTSLLARKICGENIVLFRLSDGAVRAFADYCPHRKLPLSRGTIANDEVECGYHGLRFNRDGRCVFIPAQDTIPRTSLNARAYPVVERYGLIHVWIGEPDKADSTLIPHFPEKEDPAWLAVEDYCHVNGNYLLLLDNLNDLSHLAFVHKVSFGTTAITETPAEFVIEDDIVKTRRWMPQRPQTTLYRKSGRFRHDGLIDSEQTSEFLLPSAMIVTLGAGELGQAVTPHHIVFNSVTPESECSSHYFWSVVRRDSPNDEEVSRYFHDLTARAFEEDRITIEAQQRAIDEDASGAPLRAVNADRAALGVRRVIERKLSEERNVNRAAATVE